MQNCQKIFQKINMIDEKIGSSKKIFMLLVLQNKVVGKRQKSSQNVFFKNRSKKGLVKFEALRVNFFLSNRPLTQSEFQIQKCFIFYRGEGR